MKALVVVKLKFLFSVKKCELYHSGFLVMLIKQLFAIDFCL